MESLPPEILEIIVQQLTPQDLARCSAVCLKWHEVFNQDWMWEPHCEPELIEPLRTVPCVAKPGFGAPEGPLPVSDWKLSFMRETHYWKNWKRMREAISYCGEHIFDNIDNENMLELKRENLLRVNFFTDNEVIVWCSNRIEILNIGVKPAAVVATTDTPIELYNYYCFMIGTNLLAVEKEMLPRGHSVMLVEVFTVDREKKSIIVKHRITLDHPFEDREEYFQSVLVKGHLYFLLVGEKVLLYDLNTGTQLREQSIPMIQNLLLRGTNYMIKSIASQNSDFVGFGFNSINDKTVNIYIYTVKDLTFVMNVDSEMSETSWEATLNRSWLAINLVQTIKVVNLLSNEVCVIPCDWPSVEECDDNFIISCWENETKLLKMYNPFLKSLTNICNLGGKSFKIINNSFIAIFDYANPNYCSEVWKVSGQSIDRWNIFAFCSCEINQTQTKMMIVSKRRDIHTAATKLQFYILYLW